MGFAFWLPRMAEFSSRGVERRVLMFPGYLFYRVRRGWQSLASARGIASLMTCEDRPARVREDELEYLQSLEDERGLVTLPHRFGDGDAVRITQGTYQGVRCAVRGVPTAGRYRVLWSMLGSEVEAEVAESSLAIA
jgi:transcription antitermination factor NusG